MPEIVNGITVPTEGDPVDLPGNLRTFAEDVGTAAEEIATAAGAAAAESYASSIDDERMADLAADPESAFAIGLAASYGAKTIAADEGTATGVYVVRDASANPSDPDIYLYDAEGNEL